MAKSIHKTGTPNHILVNKIMDYPISEFNDYCNIVVGEMRRRGYKVGQQSIDKLRNYTGFSIDSTKQNSTPFSGWHNEEYAKICVWNLYEKFLCGGVTKEEWNRLCDGYKEIIGEEFG